MNILVTGAAGFIGFSLINELVRNKKNYIVGVDNIDNYYSVKLKNKRINLLKKNKNFFFRKIDLTKYTILKNFLIKQKFDMIFHFAAQAGVRNVITNPKKYISDNVLGFFNILEIVLIIKPKKFFMHLLVQFMEIRINFRLEN